MIVGLTGGIGSGKTTVAQFFKEQENVAVFVADIEAKKLMNTSEEIRNKLIFEFGEDTYINGSLNRDYLSKIVFGNKEKLQKLNGIVHPAVRNYLKQFIEMSKSKNYVVYEAAILFESGNAELCDYIITVTADVSTRINRVMKRDSVSKNEVLDRMENQWKEDKKIIQSNYVIHNYELLQTKKQVEEIHNKLTLQGGLI